MVVSEAMWLEIQVHCREFFEKYNQAADLRAMNVRANKDEIVTFGGYNALYRIEGPRASIFIITCIDEFRVYQCPSKLIKDKVPLTLGMYTVMYTEDGRLRVAK